MPFTYMLECADGSYYVGSTQLLEERLQQHRLGMGADYTRTRLPVRLVWSEEHEHLGAAFGREKQVQNWSRAKRQALIEGRYADLPALARKRGKRRAPEEGLDTDSPSGSPGSTTERKAPRPPNAEGQAESVLRSSTSQEPPTLAMVTRTWFL